MIKKYFFTGLAILLPLAITLAVLIFLVNFLTKPFVGLVTKMLTNLDLVHKGFLFLSPEEVIFYGSKFLILVFLAVLTLFLGIVARWFLIKGALHLGDKLLHKIPLVNTVYKTTQDIIKTLFSSEQNNFKQVVLAPFPMNGVYVLGFISGDAPLECSEKTESGMVSVLIPTTPNPTTGFLLMYKKEDLIFLSMKPETALKYIISCGVIAPLTCQEIS